MSSDKKEFKPKIKLCIDSGRFLIKTVENNQELESVSKLRIDCFCNEYYSQSIHNELALKNIDYQADHLVIIDRDNGDYLGTYRFILSLFSNQFYSQAEFNINNFLIKPGIKLELSRACVSKKIRNSILIILLWKGLSEYIRQAKADYLFGCSSVKMTKLDAIAEIYNYFKKMKYMNDTVKITVKNNYKIKEFDRMKNRLESSVNNAKELISPLLMSYLGAGAEVCGEPALDKAFKCVDFFTVLKISELSNEVKRKFNL